MTEIVPMVKLRDLNNDNSTIGFLSVSSQITRNTNAIAETTAKITISLDANHPSSLPLSSRTCKQPTPTESSAKPITLNGTFTTVDSIPFG